mgnify:FL=1
MIYEIIFTILSGGILSLISFVLSYIKDKSDSKSIDKENKEIKEKIEIVKEFADEQTNVIDLMLKNVSELREYYVISKNQARRSFSAALTICFLGIIIYSFGIISTVFLNSDASIITLISGTVVEVISGLFFWLYVQASKQLDIYHKRLASTEKYLTAISLVDKMSEAEKDRQYEWIIRKIVMVDGENALKNEENT